MAFSISLKGAKSRNIFLPFFALSSLFPILIGIFLFDECILPLIGARDFAMLSDAFYIGLSVMILFPLLSFFLMYQWLHSLEDVTSEILSKSSAVAARQEEFKTLKIENSNKFGKQDDAAGTCEENEIQSLIRSFNTIFQTAADQLAERNNLRELLARLIGISSSLTAELDFDRLFPLIIGHVTEAMAAERTSLYVVDRDKGEIWTRVSEGIKQIRLPMGQGISGRVAATGELLNIVDAWELPYFDRSFDLINNFRTKSVLCLPIKDRQGETIGVIQVINKKNKGSFNGEDEVFLKGLTSQVAIALENSLLVDEILLSFTSSMSTLSAMVDARHHFTAGHSERVKDYALIIAEEMRLPKEEKESLRYAALLHDIGKIGIRDDILMKNGAYTPEDWVEMKTHPAKTKAILDNFHFPRPLRQVPEIAWRHHERVDGTGYPDGLKHNEVPLGAKIIAVADVFDALTSLRDYPKYANGQTFESQPMPMAQVVDHMKERAGSEFDHEVVEALIQSLPYSLLRYRGEHFPPVYVDAIIRALKPELLP